MSDYKREGEREKIPSFKEFSNSKLAKLKNFNFATVKELNVTFCLRLEYLVRIYLKGFLNDRHLKYYTDFLRRENQKLIYSIMKDGRNFEIIVDDFRKNKFSFVGFLTESFYMLKSNFKYFQRMQHYLNKYKLMDYFLELFAGFKYELVGQEVFVFVGLDYLKKRQNFVDLLELIMLFIYKNKECFFLKVFPMSSTIKRADIVEGIFTLAFQGNLGDLNSFIIKIMEIMLFNINKLADQPHRYKKMYSNYLMKAVDRFRLHSHPNFFKILEMLILNKERIIIRNVLEEFDFWKFLLKNFQPTQKKRLCISLLKVASYLVKQMDIKVEVKQMGELVYRCISYQNKRNNLVSSSIRKFLGFFKEKKAEEIEKYVGKEKAELLEQYFKNNS